MKIKTFPMHINRQPAILPGIGRCLHVTGLLAGMAVAHFTLAASGEPVEMTGEQVYSNVCIACHSPPGVGGAPALGDAEAWAPSIAQGMDTLIDHALNGFSGSTGVMPKKGERIDLSDEEVIGAIEYMVRQVDQ